MALVKCPRCELNYMKEGERYCKVCAKELRGLDDSHDHVEICLVCGERPAQPGSDLCAICLREHKRMEDSSADYADDQTGELPEEDDDLDGMEIEMDPNDTPESELKDMEEEFGSEDDEDDDEFYKEESEDDPDEDEEY